MTRAIFKFESGLEMIKMVWSEQDGSGGHFFKRHVSHDDKVFRHTKTNNQTPIYEELLVSRDDFYGYEKTSD
jgi:hypothetical protein